MTDDEDQVCGCVILLIALYAIYEVIKWAIDKYGWESAAIVFSIIAIIIVTIYIFNKTWEDADSLAEKGKVFIKFGFAWFILIFIISTLIDLLITSPYSTNRGEYIFLITTFFNMPGTSVLFYIGTKRLKSCEIGNRIIEGRKIIYFGIFWFIFWLILPVILISSNVIVTKDAFWFFFLLVAIPGAIVNIIIGKWSSKINLTKGWEDLDNAQKTLNIERDQFKKQQEDTEKQWKDIQKLKKRISEETKKMNVRQKEMDTQQEEILRTEKELVKTCNELEELENTIKNPFRLFIKDRLNKEIFIKEINELRRTRPENISSIKTEADKVISDIKEELKRLLKNEITNIEDEYYYDAFSEYFKNINGDSEKYDRIRIKYNPTIHIQTDRRNKEWAEKRRFELSRIEKLMKKE